MTHIDHGLRHVPKADGGTDPAPAAVFAASPIPDLSAVILGDVGLDAFWKLNESSGSTAADSSGNGYDLTDGTYTTPDMDPPFWQQPAGPPGEQTAGFAEYRGLQRNFPLTTPTPTIPAYVSGSEMTAEIWFYTTTNIGVIIGQGFEWFRAGQTGWGLALNGTLHLLMGRPSGAPLTAQIVSNADIPLHTWIHAAVTRDTGGTWRMYINGVQQTATSTYVPHAFARIMVGNDYWNQQAPYLGTNFELTGNASYAAMYTRALSQADLEEHYQLGTYSSGVRTMTVSGTAGIDDLLVLASGTITVTLPTAVGNSGASITVKNTGTGTITVAQNGSETTDGSTTDTSLTVSKSVREFTSDGTGWQITKAYL